MPTRCRRGWWGRSGPAALGPVEGRIRQRTGRRRAYRARFVAVAVRRGRRWHRWMGRMKGAACCGLVRGAAQTTASGASVWDGASGHCDRRVARSGLPLIALPPYSAELTPAVRLCEAIRAESVGEVSPDPDLDPDVDATCARVDAILARWNAHPAPVQSLGGWSWILDALEQLSEPPTV